MWLKERNRSLCTHVHYYYYTSPTTKEQKEKKKIVLSLSEPNNNDRRSEEAENTFTSNTQHEKISKYSKSYIYHIHSISILHSFYVAKSPSPSSLSISRFLRMTCCHSLETENQKKSPEAINLASFFFFLFLVFFFFDYLILNYDTEKKNTRELVLIFPNHPAYSFLIDDSNCSIFFPSTNLTSSEPHTQFNSES